MPAATRVLAAKIARARVVAVEPVPEAVRRLSANVALNGVIDRVVVHRVAVSDREGTVRLATEFDTMNRILAENEAGGIEVPCTTLDRLFAGEPPLLVKIDVEGHEDSVFAGARGSLASGRVRAWIVETTRPGGRAARLLSENGYEPVDYDPFARSLRPCPPRPGNLIWVRDRGEVERRLRAASPVAVKGLRI
ncbi:MAG: FkbM family methyltransferase [Geminicoccaceae bacterium]|nr:FkbM family methyltransferase [Geminicoccaceae bacterium]